MRGCMKLAADELFKMHENFEIKNCALLSDREWTPTRLPLGPHFPNPCTPDFICWYILGTWVW